jgi:TIR domain
MADLFVSYSREDKARAAEVVRLLEDYGWDVFWDQETRAGELWPKVLEEELGKARCLVALWTTTSITSRWVRIEAYEALQSEKLVPVLLDKVRPPLEFRQTQTFDLTGWNGDRDDARLAHLLADLTALAKAPSSHASRRAQIVVPTTLRRGVPPATLTNAVDASSGEPDARSAAMASQPPDAHRSSSSRASWSTAASSRRLMIGFGVAASIAAVVWLISAVDFSPEPTRPIEPTQSLPTTPAAPSTNVAAPTPPTAQPAPAGPPPTPTTAVAAGTSSPPQVSKSAVKQSQKLRSSRCLAIEEKFQQTGQITVNERDLLRSKECQS